MDLKTILEAILFTAQKPLSSKELKEVLAGACEHSEEEAVRGLKKTKIGPIDEALEALRLEHEQASRSYRLVCIAGSWQFVSQPDFAPWLKALVGHRARPPRLSQPALETLAIIAYRQPLTRAEIEKVRGVAVDGVMATLVERGLVEQVGRAELPGRPITYGTTALFLEYFGLKNLEELPAADELRRIHVEKPEGLLTVDDGLETAPDTGDEESAQPAATRTGSEGRPEGEPRDAQEDEEDDTEDEDEFDDDEEDEDEDGDDFEDEDDLGDEEEIEGDDDEEVDGDEEEDLDEEDEEDWEEEGTDEKARVKSDEPKVNHSATTKTVSASQTGEEEKRD